MSFSFKKLASGALALTVVAGLSASQANAQYGGGACHRSGGYGGGYKQSGYRSGGYSGYGSGYKQTVYRPQVQPQIQPIRIGLLGKICHQGMTLRHVEAGSFACQMGLVRGDIIFSVNQIRIRCADDYFKAMHKAVFVDGGCLKVGILRRDHCGRLVKGYLNATLLPQMIGANGIVQVGVPAQGVPVQGAAQAFAQQGLQQQGFPTQGQQFAGQQFAGQQFAGQQAGQQFPGQQQAGQQFPGQQFPGQQAGQQLPGQQQAGGQTVQGFTVSAELLRRSR